MPFDQVTTSPVHDGTFSLSLKIKDSFKKNYENAVKRYNGTRDDPSKAIDDIQKTVSGNLVFFSVFVITYILTVCYNE